MVHVLTGAVSWPSMLASSHASLDVALVVIAIVVLAKVSFLTSGRYVRVNGKVIVRCGQGHVFPMTWLSLSAITAIRFGNSRYQRCPVGNHWSVVRPVKEGDLTDQERMTIGLDGNSSS
jgi:hypothetical protein